ncbi:MAG: hypothetical protein WA323_00540, partial [Candidatus Nitrosopolaris sp.]
LSIQRRNCTNVFGGISVRFGSTRSNSKVKSTNCHARNMSVIRQQTNLKRWKRSMSYGYRWMAGTVFSSIKRTFREHVTARKFPHMVQEIFLKATLYNMFNRMS